MKKGHSMGEKKGIIAKFSNQSRTMIFIEIFLGYIIILFLISYFFDAIGAKSCGFLVGCSDVSFLEILESCFVTSFGGMTISYVLLVSSFLFPFFIEYSWLLLVLFYVIVFFGLLYLDFNDKKNTVTKRNNTDIAKIIFFYFLLSLVLAFFLSLFVYDL